MNAVALITRSRERSEPLIDALQQAGRRVLIDPLFQVVPFHEDPEPDMTGCAGLVTTSLYGYQELFKRLPTALRSLPLYCVGDASAAAAQADGMRVAAHAPRIDDLVVRMTEQAPGPDQWLLYGRGWVVTHNLPEIMEKHGIIVKEWTLYDTPAATALAQEVKTALAGGEVRDVFLFSGQAATSFVQLTQGWLDESARKALRIFAISDRVAAAIPPGTFGRISVATEPDLAGMVAAFHKTERGMRGTGPSASVTSSPTDRYARQDVPLLSHLLKDQETMGRRAVWIGTGALIGALALWVIGTMAPPASPDAPARTVAVAPNTINLPAETQQALDELTQQSQATLDALNTYKEDTGKIMDDMAAILDQVAGPVVGGRIDALEQQITGIAQAGHSSGAFGRFLSQATLALQSGSPPVEWGALSMDMQSIMASLQGLGDDERTARLTETVASGAIPPSLAGLSAQEIQAAALLLSMAQLREATARDRASFATDLATLRTLVGESNPDLLVAMDRLAPHAQTGVLTPAGLGKELRSISGDIVAASLRGDTVSISDQVGVRLAQIVQITREGKQINGNQTQQTIAAAQQQLDAGDVDGALATLKTLQGAEADSAAPLIGQMEATQAAQFLIDQLDPVLSKTLGRVLTSPTGAVGGAIGSGSSAAAPYTSHSAPAFSTGQP